jgi:hypothetical protein
MLEFTAQPRRTMRSGWDFVFYMLQPRLRIPSSLLMTPRRSVPRLETIQTMTDAELERYLLDFSLEEQRQVRELWQTHAARTTLIDFEAGDGP